MIADLSNLDTQQTLPPVDQELRAEVERLRAALGRIALIDPAEHATASRDYGRGFAYALSLVREQLMAA